MSFSATPRWCQLPEDDNFCRDVLLVRGINDWGMNTNFYKALQMILEVVVTNNVPPHEVENMVLAVFSDMQIT